MQSWDLAQLFCQICYLWRMYFFKASQKPLLRLSKTLEDGDTFKHPTHTEGGKKDRGCLQIPQGNQTCGMKL